MNFTFNEEQQELRRQARAFLNDHSSSEHVRRVMQTDAGFDGDVWRRIGCELGWPSVIVPEAYGGIGLGYVDLIALLEETGASLLCSPLFSTVCLGVNALLATGTEQQKQDYLAAIAAGELTATLAYTEANGRWDADAVQAVARRQGDRFVIDGVKTFVPDGHTADLLLVAARRDGTTGTEGISLFVVPSDTPGIERRWLPTMDQTRKQAEVQLTAVELPASALMGDAGEAWTAIETTLQRAAVALAAEQVGGMQRVLDLSVAYAKERKQFGRAIGSFQAIKHKCADMLLLVESSRSAAYYAAAAIADDDTEVPVLASLAKAYCSDAYFRCAAESIQIHGGVGFTWEYDVHLYFKRAKSTETFLGDPAYHRELVARHVGL